MAWPTNGTNGWESVGLVVTAPPVTYALPAVAKAYYYDPTRLNGAGPAQVAIVLEFHGSTVVVRRAVTTIEAEFKQLNVWGIGLLDQMVVPDVGAPCSLVLDLFADDRETVLWSVGTSPAHAAPYLAEPDSYAEQEIDIAAGAASLGTVSVAIVDPVTVAGDQDSGWVTAKLAALGLANIAGRRARLRRFVSEDLGYYVVADGPAGTPRLDTSYAAYTFDIRDTRDTERKVRIFQGGGGVSGPGEPLDPSGMKTVLPDAVWGGYGYNPGDASYLVDPAEPLLGRWTIGNSICPFDNIALVNLQATPGNATALRVVSFAAHTAMEGSSVEDFPVEDLGGGDWQQKYRVRFKSLTLLWRAQGSSDPWTEIGSGDLVLDGLQTDIGGSNSGRYTNLVLANPYPAWNTETAKEVTSIFVGDARGTGFTPTDNQDIELVVIYRGPPTEDAPLYLEGLTAGQLARNVYAGMYSERAADGSVVPTGIRYDEAAVLQMTDLVRMRLFEPITDARDWLEKNIYAPTGWVPALDDLGLISPVSQVAPTSVAGLLAIVNAITEPSPEWSAGDRIVNVIRFTYFRDYRPGNPDNAETGDGLAAREIVLEFEDPYSVTRHGRQVLEISGECFRAIGDSVAEPVTTTAQDELAYQLAQLRQMHVQARYSLGAPTMSVAAMRDFTLGLRAGSWVVLDLTWFPDYVTQRRGLVALAQVVALGDLDCKWRRLLLEVVVPLSGGVS